MAREIITTVERLREVLKDSSLHVQAELDDEEELFYLVRPRRGSPFSPSPFELLDGLFEEAQKAGLLLESEEFCSCYELNPTA